jgi:hypothetical protein
MPEQTNNKLSSFSTPVITRRLNNINNTTGILENVNYSQISGSAFGISSSFRYDLPGTGLKSTQELNVDWSEFKNHVFFNSAQIKTNAAIQKIFDGFPFDGNKQEYELFFDNLTGYEKWIYDQFPKNVGYMFFSGTKGSEQNEGTFITIKDQAGINNTNGSRNISGRQFLNPGTASDLMLEFQLFIPPVSNSNQIVLQKYNSTNNHGYQVCLHETGSTSEVDISFSVMSGSHMLSTQENKLRFVKGQFYHLCFFWQRSSGHVFGYNNHELVSSSSNPVFINGLDFDSDSFIIGSGTNSLNFSQKNTLSGAIDELRVWHKFISSDLRIKNEKRNIYAQPDLKLYLKLNEPSGSNSNLVLDYSGNSLHGQISDQGISLGVKDIPSSSIAGRSVLLAEKPELNPNLFGVTTEFSVLTSSLLTSAKLYDNNNPNWILNLVPAHFFLDGDYEESLATTDGELLEGINFFGFNKATLKQSQALLLVLYLWAKFFDELKLMIDSFAYLNYVDYIEEDTIPDKFLGFFAKRHGFELPNLFNNSSITQFIDGEDLVNSDFGYGTSLKTIQYKIWRRILANIQDIKKSKGTIHSIKSFIRSTGIDPDNNFRIRERGATTKKNITYSRQNRTEVMKQINFVSGGLLISPFLSSSRTEIGEPEITNSSKDGLLTSGSWSVEFMFQIPRSSANTNSTQSVLRLFSTGSLGKMLLGNIVVASGSGVTTTFNPYTVGFTPVSMSVSGFDPMDGNVWNLCFTKHRADQLGYISSSYELRVARNSFGKIENIYSSSVFLNDSLPNPFNFISPSFNASGSWFELGNNTITDVNTGSFFTGVSFDNSLFVFSGKLSQIRFWSKHLTDLEWSEHVRNPKSIGVLNPVQTNCFNSSGTGSFERLRIHAHCDQPVTGSDITGKITITDFSQNSFHLSGTSFIPNSRVVEPKQFYYSYVNPTYDDLSTTNKVRVRSFISMSNVYNSDESFYAEQGSVYSINPHETSQDSSVLSIDYSAVDALNQDMSTMFATLEQINNSIGSPELLFSPDYPDLEFLQKLYFNNLTSPINLKNCFDFYKWFDTSFGDFIKQLIPRKTKYFGINFVLESHMLERPKFEYNFGDSYVGESNRDPSSTLTLQFFRGKINRS